MSDTKLGIPHKIAGIIERWVSTTKVKNYKLNLYKKSKQLDLSLSGNVSEISARMDAKALQLNPVISTETVEIVQRLTSANIGQCKLNDIDTSITDLRCNFNQRTSVQNHNCRFQPNIHDFMKINGVSQKLHYKTKVKNLNIEKKIQPKVKKVTDMKFPDIKNNLYSIQQIPVTHSSAELSFVSEKEQLEFWKEAVIRSKKDPKNLNIIGLFYHVPYYHIQKLKINFDKSTIQYSFKPNVPFRSLKTYHLAIFQDMENNKAIIIDKQVKNGKNG